MGLIRRIPTVLLTRDCGRDCEYLRVNRRYYLCRRRARPLFRLIGIFGGYWGIGWGRQRRPRLLAIPQNEPIRKCSQNDRKCPQNDQKCTKNAPKYPKISPNTSKHLKIRSTHAPGLPRRRRARGPAPYTDNPTTIVAGNILILP